MNQKTDNVDTTTLIEAC